MYVQKIFYIFLIINTVIAISIIILERKKPEKTIAWLLFFITLPPLGFIFYLFLGRNWKRNTLDNKLSDEIYDLINPIITQVKDPTYKNLMELTAMNSDSPIFINNTVEIFKDGIEKFVALKRELLKAEHHIHLEYYIVKSDSIGNEIKDILIKKSNEGVKIRFIMDSVGSIKCKRSYIKELQDNGVEVVQYTYFLAPLLRKINTQINYRNHRKIAIIDGKVGFIGGINIGDEYLGNSKLGYWRDTHMMVKGDFVLSLQGVFLDDFLTIESATNNYTFFDKEFKKYFPQTKEDNLCIMQTVKSGPESPYPSIMQSILRMIYMARQHIYITTPYFVPTDSIMEALKIAILTGVNVKILVPLRADHYTVSLASRTYLSEIAKCGGEIYFYNPESFIHAKSITIDGKVSTLGTSNIDVRSFELNYEINAIIYDEEITKNLENQFFEDLKNSICFTYNDFENTPKLRKLIEGICRIFSSLL